MHRMHVRDGANLDVVHDVRPDSAVRLQVHARCCCSKLKLRTCCRILDVGGRRRLAAAAAADVVNCCSSCSDIVNCAPDRLSSSLAKITARQVENRVSVLFTQGAATAVYWQSHSSEWRMPRPLHRLAAVDSTHRQSTCVPDLSLLLSLSLSFSLSLSPYFLLTCSHHCHFETSCCSWDK
jgi:hypothetical protein